ncbi:Phenylacetate-coenzyme A ligase [compost metagenome]
MLIIRGVNVFPTQIEEQILKVKQLAEVYELHLQRTGNLDSIDVHVELKHDLQHLDADQQKLIANELGKQIKTHIGISARILIQPFHALKRSEGKACHVFDNRPKA